MLCSLSCSVGLTETTPDLVLCGTSVLCDSPCLEHGTFFGSLAFHSYISTLNAWLNEWMNKWVYGISEETMIQSYWFYFIYVIPALTPLTLKPVRTTSLLNTIQSKCCLRRLSKSCLISLCRQTVKWVTYFSRQSRHITYFQWEKALLTLATPCLE